MSWEALKSAVTAVITANGNEEITGQILQDLINGNLIPQLGAAKFKGIATPTTNPGTPSNDVFYLASTNGDYSNFGTTSLNNEIAVIQWVSDTWVKHRVIDNSVSMRYKKGSIMPFKGNVEIDTTAATPTIELTGRVFVAYNGGFYDASTVQATTDWDTFSSLTRLNYVLFNQVLKTFHVVDFSAINNFDQDEHVLVGSITRAASNSDGLTFYDIGGVCIVDGVRYLNGIKTGIESETETKINALKQYSNLSFQTFTGGFSINTTDRTFTADGRFFFNKSTGFDDVTIAQTDVPFDTQGGATDVYNILYNPTTQLFAVVRFNITSYSSDDWITVGIASQGRYWLNGNYSVDGTPYFNGNILLSGNYTDRDSNYSVFGWGGNLIINTAALTVEVTGRLFVSYNGGFIDVTAVQAATAWDGGTLSNGLQHILINKTTKLIAIVNFTLFANYPNSEWVLLGTLSNNGTPNLNLKGVCIMDGTTYINGIAQTSPPLAVPYNSERSLQNVEYQGLGTDYSHIVFYGQSLSMGWEADAALTTAAVPGTFMLGDRVWIDKGNSRTAVLTPLVATDQGTVAESPAVSAAHVFKDLINKYHWIGNDTEVVTTNCGEGGQSIERLSKGNVNGTDYYTNSFMAALNLMNTVAQANSKTVSCPAIVYMQGEHNYTGSGAGTTVGTDQTRDKDTYKALLLTLKNDTQADIMATYGQSKKPLFFLYQVAGNYINRTDMSINMAQVEFAEENDDVILLNPTHGLPDYNGGHLSSNGYRWYGELIAKDLYNGILNGKDLYNTKVQNIRVEGNELFLDCSVFAPPLVIDTHTVEAKTSNGFLVADSSGTVTINSVEIIGGTTVKLTLSRALNSGAYITYAGSGRNGTGNLRDSHDWVSKYEYADETSLRDPSHIPLDADGNNLYGKKYPCWNWLAAFYKTLN